MTDLQLLPTISSDEEDATTNPTPTLKNQTIEEESDLEVDSDFEFGGILGEDEGGSHQQDLPFGGSTSKGWSFKSALEILKEHDGAKNYPERMEVGDIIAAARSNLKRSKQKKEEKKEGKKEVHIEKKEEEDEDSDSEEETEEVDETMETDVVRIKGSKNTEADAEDLEAGSDADSTTEEDKREALKAAAFYDTPTRNSSSSSTIEIFSQLNLSRPLLRAIAKMGFVTPTPIQSTVIPPSLAGRDICASAVTGSGKTAAFLLPLSEKLLQRTSSATRALILTPTRELAAQCLSMLSSIAHYTNIRSALIVGGAKNVASQASELRSRPEIVIATPGRLIDHLANSPGVHLDHLEFLILDEADRLLDMGFVEEIEEILKACPSQRQTMLFSATMNTKVDELIRMSLKKPIRVHVTVKPGEEGTANDVEVAPRLQQEFIRIRPSNESKREAIILSLLTRTFRNRRAIVFFDTKAMAHRAMILYGLCSLKCTELHGNLTQPQRLEALESFRTGDVDILLATDVAARGLDIDHVDVIINFEMPRTVETYVHRIGRTARAGRSGTSCTLIGEGRRKLMKKVLRDAEMKNGVVRSRTVPASVIRYFCGKIEGMEENVEQVLAAEAVAKMDRMAEIEANRAENLILHHEEIMARPRREWPLQKQLEEKKEVKEVVKKEKPMKLLTRRQRRAREAEERMRKDMEERKNQSNGEEEPDTVITEQPIKPYAKAKKKQAHPKKRQNEMSMQDEQRQRKKNKKGVIASDSLGDAGLFDEERVSFATKPTKNEGRAPVYSRFHFTEFNPNKKFGKGGKRGTKSFKSKSKYNRRK